MSTFSIKKGLNMEKELYEPTDLEIIEFLNEDVIVTSGNPDDAYEGEMP